MAPENEGFKGTKLSHSAPYGPITAFRKIIRRGDVAEGDPDFEGALAMDDSAFDIAMEIAKSK